MKLDPLESERIRAALRAGGAFTIDRAQDIIWAIDAGQLTWEEAVTQSLVPVGLTEEMVRARLKEST